MVSANLSDFASTIEHRTQFGKIVDKVLAIVENNENKPSMAKQIDRVFKEHLSALFRQVRTITHNHNFVTKLQYKTSHINVITS